MEVFNRTWIGQMAETILALMGVGKRGGTAPAIRKICTRGKLDRLVIYNPDAVASWIVEKYREELSPLFEKDPFSFDMVSCVPPVTPVCFASMYSGLSPEKHGIQSYTKPVLECETVFDVLPEHGKKCAIVSTEGDSISMIFLGRDVDYFIYKTKEECNRKALELIEKDEHDLIVLYNGDYDWAMHRFTPEGKRSLRALRENAETWRSLVDTAERVWKKKRWAVAFAPDHGCHRSFLPPGNHGEKIAQDMNIKHFWHFSW